MDEKMQQRILLSAVVMLGLIASVLYLNNRDLRSEVARTRTDPEEIRRQVETRARRMVVDAVRDNRRDFIAAAQWLHSYYQSPEGLQRPDGLWIDKHPDFDAIGAWLFDVYLAERLNGADDATARKRVTDAIQKSDEWRRKHPTSR
jgi:hypothetical protein